MESLGSTGIRAGSEASDGDERHSSLKPLLRLAALRGDEEHVLRYLELGGDVEARDQQGRTLHMLAASKGHVDLCRLISEHALQIERLAVQNAENPTATPDGLRSDERDAEAEESAQTRATDSSQNSTPEGDEFESEFFASWEEEAEIEAPLEDPSLRSTIQAVQEVISKHVIVDKDEDWSDLAILLPSQAEISLIRELNHGSTYSLFEAVVHRAQVEGNFNPHDLKVISREVEGDEDGDVLRQLTILLGQIDSVSEEDDEWLPPLHLQQDNEPELDSSIHDLEEFMQDLSSRTNDPYSHFEKIAQSSVLLDRAGEERVGLLLDLSLRDAYRAIAENPLAAASMERLANDLAQGRISTGQLSHVSAEDEDQESESTEASDDQNDEDWLGQSSNRPGLTGMLDRARDACLAWHTNSFEANLEREALVAVSALELTSSTVRRLEKEFDSAGHASPPLRRAVHRLSRIENEMFQANIRLAVHVADSYAWSSLPRMDRIQESLIGLLKAIDRFDYRRGYKFSTYAMWWLKQSVVRAIGDRGRLIRLPVHVVEKINRMFKSVREAGRDSLEGMSAQEVAYITDLSLSEVTKTLAVIKDAASWDQQETLLELALATPDSAPTPEEFSNELLRRQAVLDCLSTLPPKEAEVIQHRFGLVDGNDKTLEEVGQIFGVTRERIRQIESKALRLMRHPARRLNELVNGKPEADDAAE
ncbi:sigma-70 family RNA polymerase sigma factor [Stenotrophomonas sp. PFBMAA-4]|uniref:sigma-70 family RNA polymerase sigma factor n=1 Tax=Stenotrophomonas sp. PFBMAA-4 TaxID=3043301 RepID=UPI0024B5AA5A|nr:sigma-70 family RNA polymerase sigma factor [Stenotrophomonas sp. PFBMAA-4]MDI9274101.1 sigma-70 family RNA polymerase sigma factor [Stenotrophomonas sp. PFBMAA-4]